MKPYVRTFLRWLSKPKPRFKVGQVIKRTWEEDNCWRRVDAIDARWIESSECEECGQMKPGHWRVEYEFHRDGQPWGCLGTEWDDQMHAQTLNK